MSRRVRVFRVDAFTTAPCTGNPASVILDTDDLNEREMHAITREQGGVDTAFVLPPDAADHDLRLRFFTPRSETGLVGHATLAVHAVRAALRLPECFRQKQRGSIVEIGHGEGPHGKHFSFSQAMPPLHGPLAADQLTAVMNALGVAPEELDPDCPNVVAGAGAARVLIAVRSGATLARLRPDLPRLSALSAAGNPAGFFVYSLKPAIADCDSEARMFCPALGIPEDPVSGNAHALLATHLQALGRIPNASAPTDFTSRQGHHMGRPGVLNVRVEGHTDGSRRIRVTGSARIVFEASLDL